MRSRLVVALGLSSVMMIACSNQPEVLVDTSGARFGWECSKGVCELRVLPETPDLSWVSQSCDAGYSYAWRRFVEILAVCGFDDGSGWSSGYGDGRFLACESDEDCPQLDFHEHPSSYECSAGLCQNVDTEVFPRDRGFVLENEAVALCLAETPRGEANLAEVHALLVDHCGESAQQCPLPLPDSCWQP